MNKVVPLAAAALRQSRINNRPARVAGTVADVIASLRPSAPLYVIWPERIQAAARHFMRAFPGETMYAVKTNPDRTVLQALNQAGVRSFDAASIEEIRLVRKTLRKAKIYFMHTVKSPEAIAEAYRQHGVRDFVIDTVDELKKIMRATGSARDLTLYVRLALPKNGSAAIDFSCKFGAAPDEAAELLRKCRNVAHKVGLCFHVGTQTTDPQAYARAVTVAAETVRMSGVSIDILDVGGGFPVPYPGQDVPALETCVNALKEALKAEGMDRIPLLAEPGRALVAQGGALVVRVELRRGTTLYLNDGIYGGLFDAGPLLNTPFPMKAHRPDGAFRFEPHGFRLAGPTCDSLDMMEGPYALPGDIRMGDWIEIGNLGAYSQSLRTNFNGFGASDMVCIYEGPATPAHV